MNEKKCRAIVRERSGNRCEICGDAAETMHHRRLRSQGGPWRPSNILHLCGDGTRKHHGMLTNTNGKRAEYEAEGWLVPSWRRWDEVPVRTWWGVLLLDDDGGWTNLGFDMPAEEHTLGCTFWTSDDCDCGGGAVA